MQKTITGILLMIFGLAQIARAGSSPGDTTTTAARPSFSLILDSRNSFLKDHPIKIYGLNIGVKFNKRFRIGLGGYALHRFYDKRPVTNARLNLQDTLSPQLKLFFITPNFTYTFLNCRWVELSIPVEIGIGSSRFSVYNSRDELIRQRKGAFIPAEIGFYTLFKLTRWVGVSGLVGYRKSLVEVDFKGDFDGWYYSYRVNIFVSNIWQDYRQHRQRKKAIQQASGTPSRTHNSQ